MKDLNQRGSTHFVAILGVITIAIVGVVGYGVLSTRDQGAKSPASFKSSSSIPTTINSTADLRKADSSLDSTAIESSINPDQLDSDINAVL